MSEIKQKYVSASKQMRVCVHCGLPVPQGLLGEPFNKKVDGEVFCCSGCAFVYDTLHGHGLDEYYRLKQSLGVKEGIPVTIKNSGYEYMDSHEFKIGHLNEREGGEYVVEFYLTGVHCAACVWVVERLPQILEGVEECKLNLAKAQVRIAFDPKKVSLSSIASMLNSIGYSPYPVDSEEIDAKRVRDERRMLLRVGVAGLSAMNVMLFAISLYEGAWSGISQEYSAVFNWASMLIALPAVFYSAFPFYDKAFRGLRLGVLHLDLPIAIGVLGGFLVSAYNTINGAGDVYFDSICMLVFLLLVGRLLQQRAVNVSISKLNALPKFLPSSAIRVNPDQSVEEVYVDTIRVGDKLTIRGGEIIAADGRVVFGHALCNFAVVTGESKARAVHVGDVLAAGVKVIDGQIELEVSTSPAESRIAKVLSEVRNEATKDAPLSRVTDRIGSIFVIGIFMLSAFTWGYWSQQGLELALNATLALIVISCPCALALAVPLTMSVALGRAASRGIFIRGPGVLERAALVSCLYLDKTGTLTHGSSKVVSASARDAEGRYLEWNKASDAYKRETAAVILALESGLVHPAAEALRQFVSDVPAPAIAIKHSYVPGLGVESQGDKFYLLGNLGLLEKHRVGVSEALLQACGAMEEAMVTPVFFADRKGVSCVFGIADAIKGDARQSIDSLKGIDIAIGILSGDRQTIVDKVANELGIEAMRAKGELLPEQKSDMVLTSKGTESTAMVGDGMNDADALSAADVGIGVHGGAEACLKNSDVYIASGKLTDVVEVFAGSKRSVGIIKGALYFSLFYNAVGSALAISGYVGPLAAAVAMPLSSLTVISMASLRKTF